MFFLLLSVSNLCVTFLFLNRRHVQLKTRFLFYFVKDKLAINISSVFFLFICFTFRCVCVCVILFVCLFRKGKQNITVSCMFNVSVSSFSW